MSRSAAFPLFQKVAILGPGLLGGSVALAAQKIGLEVVLWGRREAIVAQALELGLQATTDLEAAVSEADLIVLAVPVGVMATLAKTMQPFLRQKALVTDVGSVKSLPHAQLEPILAKSGHVFVGSHPMAGSEQTGIAAARGNLLEDAACILTNDGGAPEETVQNLVAFWEALGMRLTVMSARQHDEVVARISHFPHAMAMITAAVGLAEPAHGQFAGGGFRDTSRVASGAPTMWAEIMMENRVALAETLRESRDQITKMLAQLENQDQAGLEEDLMRAKALRDDFSETQDGLIMP